MNARRTVGQSRNIVILPLVYFRVRKTLWLRGISYTKEAETDTIAESVGQGVIRVHIYHRHPINRTHSPCEVLVVGVNLDLPLRRGILMARVRKWRRLRTQRWQIFKTKAVDLANHCISRNGPALRPQRSYLVILACRILAFVHQIVQRRIETSLPGRPERFAESRAGRCGR